MIFFHCLFPTYRRKSTGSDEEKPPTQNGNVVPPGDDATQKDQLPRWKVSRTLTSGWRKVAGFLKYLDSFADPNDTIKLPSGTKN